MSSRRGRRTSRLPRPLCTAARLTRAGNRTNQTRKRPVIACSRDLISCLRLLRLPSRRPEFLHSVAEGFPRRRGHLAATTATDGALDRLDGRRQETSRAAPKMGEKLRQRLDFSLEFLIAMFCAPPGKFEDVRSVFWHRSIRISERRACLALFGHRYERSRPTPPTNVYIVTECESLDPQSDSTPRLNNTMNKEP